MTPDNSSADQHAPRPWSRLSGKTLRNVLIALVVVWILIYTGIARALVGVGFLVVAGLLVRAVLRRGKARVGAKLAQGVGAALCTLLGWNLLSGRAEHRTSDAPSRASISRGANWSCSEDDARTMAIGAMSSEWIVRSSIRFRRWERVGPCAFAFAASGSMEKLNDGGVVGEVVAVGRVEKSRPGGLPQVTALQVFGPE